MMSFSQSRHGARRRQFDTILVLLGCAADREDQMLLLIPTTMKVRGRPLERLLKSLLSQGLIEEIPVESVEQEWRSDDAGRYGLRITSAGLKAIGVPALQSGLDCGSPWHAGKT